MKKTLATVALAVATVVTLSIVPAANIGPFGVDVVSAASETGGAAGGGTTSGQTSAYTSSVSGILRYGSTGENVKALQTALNNNGFNPGAIDGIFGPLTQTAVKDYQKANGLVVDGIAGPKTLGKLIPASAAAITRFLSLGSYGDDVKLVQTNLNKNGFNLVVDGVFGAKTQAAVKDYQKANGLAVDGVVGPKTIAKLIPATTPTTPTTPTTTPDVIASASVTDNAAVFEKSIGTAGKWIVCTTADLTFDHAIVVDGNFTNGKTTDSSKKETGLLQIQRKIGLYTQDKDRKVLDEFTLTAPKITILSQNASIEHGTVKGDIYVSAQNFQLKGAKVEGNIFFTNKGAQETFKQNDGKVTGMQTLLQLPETVDAYASASRVMTEEKFEEAISSTPSTTSHKWIIAMLDNLTFDHDLVLDGDFKKDEKDAAPQRKLAIYAHDLHNSKLTTGRFILTAPSLTIKSANANITKGMFVGDVYVTVPNFKLVDAIIYGNVYFANENCKNTFTKDATSIICGKQEIKVKQ